MDENNEFDEISVIVMPEGETDGGFHDPMRGGMPDLLGKLRMKKMKLTDLAGNVKLFMRQVETLMGDVPDAVGEFDFAEFEVSAGVTAGGQLTLCGVAGAQAGVQGGLKFVFKKRSTTAQ